MFLKMFENYWFNLIFLVNRWGKLVEFRVEFSLMLGVYFFENIFWYLYYYYYYSD